MKLLYKLPQKLIKTSRPSLNVAVETEVAIQGLIFDMDGTLTVPVLDFVEMKRRLGLRKDEDIVMHMKSLQGDARIEADRIVTEMEVEAMLAMEIQPGLHDLLQGLEEIGIPKAILTRNFGQPVNHLVNVVLEGKHKFHPCIDRDWDGKPKPFPDAIHHIAKHWNIHEENLLMIGDSIDDLTCGKKAGAVAVLLKHDGINHHIVQEADLVIDSLGELLEEMERGFLVVR